LTVTFFGCVKLSAAEGDVAKPVFGPSGVLRERIERGDHVDVFASARFALFVLPEQGQAILHQQGFDLIGLP
jgi:ABC-type molybdate transport system substrate-binding protein